MIFAFRLFAFLASWLCAAPAFAAPAIPQQRQECDLGAFVSDTDPAGLNVRSGPGTNFPVVGHLPPVTANAEDPSLKAMAEIVIKAGENGWFLISEARDNEMLTGAAPRPMFKGSGWVSGSGLAVKSQAERGYISPDEKSAVIVAARETTLDNAELLRAGRLKACNGAWALVEYGRLGKDSEITPLLTVEPAATIPGKPGAFRAWLDKICAIQETSCSGF